MVRFGLRLPPFTMPVNQLLEIAGIVDHGGYDVIWVPEGGYSAFQQLALLALNTTSCRLGTGIVTAYSRPPSTLAMEAIGLCHVSEGRAILGLGTGSRANAERVHGVTFAPPIRHMRELVHFVRSAARGDKELPPIGGHQVQGFSVRETCPNLPVYLAALGPQMCRLAGQVADGVLLNWVTPSYAAEAVREVRRGAEQAGRDPAAVSIHAYIRTCVHADVEQAKVALRAESQRYLRQPFYRAMLDSMGFAAATTAVAAAAAQGGDKAAAAAVPDDLLATVTVFGTPKQCQARLEEYRSAGVDVTVIAPVPAGSDSFASWKTTVSAFAQ